MKLLFVQVFLCLLILNQNIKKASTASIKDFLCNEQTNGQSEESTNESMFLLYKTFIALFNLINIFLDFISEFEKMVYLWRK